MTTWADLFTNRQLIALTTFSDLVSEARARVHADGASPAYADAVATYLGLALQPNSCESDNVWRMERGP